VMDLATNGARICSTTGLISAAVNSGEKVAGSFESLSCERGDGGLEGDGCRELYIEDDADIERDLEPEPWWC